MSKGDDEAAVLPDFAHPVVMALRCAVRNGSGREKYTIDEQGVAMVEQSLREHAADPALSGGLIGLLALASAFWEEENSPNAAESVILLIGRMYPELVAIHQGQHLLPQEIRVNFESGGFSSHLEKTAPSVGQKPEGSLSVANILQSTRRKLGR
jgi:hypothetical protein